MNATMTVGPALAFTLVEDERTVRSHRLEEALRLIKPNLPFFPGLKKIGDVLNPPPAFGRKTPRSNFPVRFGGETKCLWLARIRPKEERCRHFDGICRHEGEHLLITEMGRLIKWLYRYEVLGNFEGHGCLKTVCRCDRPEEEGKISAFFWMNKDDLAPLFQADSSFEERIIRELKLLVELYVLPPKNKVASKDASDLHKAIANL